MFGRRKPEPDRSAAPGDESPDDDLTGHRPTGPIADESAHRLQHGVIEYSRWTVRLLVIGVGLVAAFWVMGQLWSILLPILLRPAAGHDPLAAGSVDAQANCPTRWPRCSPCSA